MVRYERHGRLGRSALRVEGRAREVGCLYKESCGPKSQLREGTPRMGLIVDEGT